jgi:putative nucleotidyltransferase with HDIG domain
MIELLSLFREPDRDIDRVVELISHEPSLTAEVLKRCNSACFMGDTPAEETFTAVSRLGFYEVYTVVVGVFGASTVSLPGLRDVLDINALWQHAVMTAAAASALTEDDQESAGAAFTAGLLHDVGKLILASAEGPRYAKIRQESAEHGESLVTAERAAFGLNHAEIGGRLLSRWNLPEDVVTAVLHHHRDESANSLQEITPTIYFANRFITHPVFAGDGVSQFYKTSVPKPVGLTPELESKIQKHLGRVQSLLGG